VRSVTGSRATAAAAAVLAFITFVLLAQLADLRDSRIRNDEAHKISESAFFGLICRGDFHNRYWNYNNVDRTNPPVGKYVFGAAITLSGLQVPPMPTWPVLDPNMSLTKAVVARSLPYIAAVRRVSTLCVALIAAILAWLAVRTFNVAAAIVASLFFMTHYLTLLLAGYAVFDPLFILFATLLMLLATLPPTIPRWVLAGIIGGLVFQTRLNGALFFAITAIVMIIRAIRQWKGPLLGSAAFAVTSLLVNPYYWPAPVARLQLQFRDIRNLVGVLATQGAALTGLGDRLDFTMQIVFGDLQGLLFLAAAITAIAWLALRWRTLGEEWRSCALWCVLTIVAILSWLPVTFQRYLFAIVPPLCFLTGCGLAGLGAELLPKFRWRSAQTRSAA
jgi:4-amino-4-deoxy-L-arabinose transferase-like glycosyltransferase